MPGGIFLGLCRFERLQDLVSGCLGIRQTLQSRCVLRKFIVTEVAVTSARRQD